MIEDLVKQDIRGFEKLQSLKSYIDFIVKNNLSCF